MRLFEHRLVVGAAILAAQRYIEPVLFYATVQLGARSWRRVAAAADSGLSISEDESAQAGDLNLMTQWRAGLFLCVGVDGDGGTYEIGADWSLRRYHK